MADGAGVVPARCHGATKPATTEPSVAAGPQAVAAPSPPDPAPASAPEADAGAASAPAPTPPPAEPAPPAAPPAKADDAINLGSTVLPILLKSYWKQGVGLLLVVAVIVVLIVAL